jgi:hypothetical protein
MEIVMRKILPETDLPVRELRSHSEPRLLRGPEIDRWILSFVHSIATSRHSTAGIATGHVLDGRGFGVPVTIGVRFAPPHVVQTGSDAHSAPYPIGTGGSFPGSKAAGAWSRPLLRSRISGFVHPLPHKPSCRTALLVNHREIFTFFTVVLLNVMVPKPCATHRYGAQNVKNGVHRSYGNAPKLNYEIMEFSV